VSYKYELVRCPERHEASRQDLYRPRPQLTGDDPQTVAARMTTLGEQGFRFVGTVTTEIGSYLVMEQTIDQSA
jgi:hypothetical protein